MIWVSGLTVVIFVLVWRHYIARRDLREWRKVAECTLELLEAKDMIDAPSDNSPPD